MPASKQNGRKEAAARHELRVLVHPFYFLEHRRGYRQEDADVLFNTWRNEIDGAAEKNQYFAFVSDNLKQSDFERIEKCVENNRFNSLQSREERLLAYAIQKMAKKKLIFVPSGRSPSHTLALSFLRKEHLEKKGIDPLKTRAVLFGERTGGCIASQRSRLAEAGVVKRNISILAHKSFEIDGVTPWAWQALLSGIRRNGKRALGEAPSGLVGEMVKSVRQSRAWRLLLTGKIKREKDPRR